MNNVSLVTMKCCQQVRTRENKNPPISPFEKGGLKGDYKGNVTMFITGIFIAITGYLLLTQTNQGGNNWASYVSAFSITIGYIVVALSLIMDFPPSKK
ncbi:MAG: hypothetical protein ABII25_08360 [bacterium]